MLFKNELSDMASVRMIFFVLISFAAYTQTLNRAICPDNKAIIVRSTETDGMNAITCSVRFPPDKLYYYQWLIWPGDQAVFYNVVNQNMSETDPAFRHIVVNEVHNFNDNGTGKSTILINSINSHPETIYKCRVVLNDHSVCIGDTSGIAEVCPHNDSIKMWQNALVSNPEGLATIICEFRVPDGQLHYYTWSAVGWPAAIYTFPGVDQRERHVLDATGGKSILTLHTVNIQQDVKLVCSILLRNGEKCLKEMSLKFEDPVLDITIKKNSNPSAPQNTAVCTIIGSIGKPIMTLSLKSGDQVWTLNNTEVRVVEPFNYKYITFANINIDKPGILTCNVTDRKNRHTVSRLIQTSVCPHDNSMTIVQSREAPRPNGNVNLTCYFRVPVGLLFRYAWLTNDNIEIFTKEVFTNTLKRDPDGLKIMLDEQHELYIYGGKTTISLVVDIFAFNSFKCRVTLTNSTTCEESFIIDFEDPLIWLGVWGKPNTGKTLQHHGQTTICMADNAIGTPNITLSEELMEINTNVSLFYNNAHPKSGVYHQGILILDTYRKNMRLLTCTVSDDFGTYKKNISIPQTVCPARQMEIKQNVAFGAQAEPLELVCRLKTLTKNITRPIWVFGGKQYNESEGCIYSWKVVDISEGYQMISTLVINITYNDPRIILCGVVFGAGQSCIMRHVITYRNSHIHDEKQSVALVVLPYFFLVLGISGLALFLIVGLPSYASRYWGHELQSIRRRNVGGLAYEGIVDTFEMKRVRFVDADFGATSVSPGDVDVPLEEKDNSTIEWRRPSELHGGEVVPQMCTEGGPRVEDILQGSLNNGWLLASLAAVVEKNLIRLDQKQDLSQNGPGVFHIRIWWSGEWKDVVIDDRLPVKNNKLIFAHSPDVSVYWVALVEKAFAKLYKSYRDLESIGFNIDVMTDLTGGIVVYRNTGLNMDSRAKRDEPNWDGDIFENITVAMECNYPVTCSTPVCYKRKARGAYANAGARHYFIISKVETRSDSRDIYIYIRNSWKPAGDSCECLNRIWIGSTQEDKQEYKVFQKTFLKVFDQVQICYLDDNTYPEDEHVLQSRVWSDQIIALHENQHHADMMAAFPQYTITCTEEVKLMIGVLQIYAPPTTASTRLYHAMTIYCFEMERDVTAPLSMRDKKSKRNRRWKFSRYDTYREQGGYIHAKPHRSYVLAVIPRFADIKIEFLLRIFANSAQYTLKRLGPDRHFHEVQSKAEEYDYEFVKSGFESSLN